MRRLCRVAQVLLVPAVVLACSTLILLVNITRESVRNGVTTLTSAERLSTDMATLAQRVTGVTKTLGGGLTDTAATIDNLARLTGTVRSVVDVVAPFSPKIRDTLRATRVRLEAQDHRLGLLIWLGCGAVILFALVLFLLLQAVARPASAA